MSKIKTYLAIAGIVGIAIAVTYFIMKSKREQRVNYVRGAYQQKLDSATVVSQNLVLERAQIKDSLDALDKRFSKYVTRTKQKITSYTTIIGHLKIQKDKLQDSVSALQTATFMGDLLAGDSLVTNKFKDTLVSRTNTWSDSLFATRAVAKFSGDSLYLDSYLSALRNPRIDVVTTQAEDGSQVNTYVRSSDFDSLNVHSVTEVKHKKSTLEKVAPYAVVTSIVLAIKQAITLIKSL